MPRPPTRLRPFSARFRARLATRARIGETRVWEKFAHPRRDAIVAALQVRVAAKENARLHDGIASGASYYNYFRDFDPSIGRYMQSDPIGLKGGINTYGYAKANPLALSDPFGLDSTPGGGGGEGSSAGPCSLVAQVPLYSTYDVTRFPPKQVGFWMCIYKCQTQSCPPKVWFIQKYFFTPWGCPATATPQPPIPT